MAEVKPVKGGDRLDAYLAKLAKKVARKGHVRVGFLEGATYPDGAPVAEIAAIQNFGAPAAGIPPRPFFSNMVNREAGGWGVKMAQVLKRAEYDGEKALALMGQGIAGQLRQSIVDTNDPPLKPETARRKGFDKPLVDTGHMLASVDSEVVMDQ
jgi:hypothetical protein